MGAGRGTWQYINEKQESTAGQHEINTQTLVHILTHYCHRGGSLSVVNRIAYSCNSVVFNIIFLLNKPKGRME